MGKSIRDIKVILLDLDGTLVDSTEAYMEAARTAYEKTGYRIPDQQKVLEIPKRLEQKRPINSVSSADTARFLKVYLKRFHSITMEKSQPFRSVDKTLLTLSQKAKLALITMRFVPEAAVALELKRFGLAQYFTSVVTALDTQNPKPSPEALIKAANHLNVNLCECVVVGDSISDVRAGKAARIATIGVLSGLFKHEELASVQPDLILNTVNELPKHIDFSE